MKQKYVFIKLTLLLVAAPLLIWFGALSSTVDSYVRYHKLGGDVTLAHEKGNGLDLKEVVWEDQLSNGTIMGEIERRYKDISVSLYTPVMERSEAGVSIIKAEVELKGNYHSLLGVLHYLETEGHYALSDIVFERKDDREKQVKLSIVVRQLVKNE